MKTSGLLIALTALATSAAAAKPAARPAAIPPALSRFLTMEPPRKGWRVDWTDMKPPFLTGDFLGSGHRDFAVPVIEEKGRKSDVLFYLADGKTRRLAHDLGGAVWPGPLWRIVPKSTRVRNHAEINGLTGAAARHGPGLVGDGIVFEKPESSSALVYWSKGRFHITWTSD